MKGFNTRAIHSFLGVTASKEAHGAIRGAVYDTVTFEFESAKAMEDAFRGRSPHHAYTRITNPTVTEFEQRLSSLSGAFGVIALSSGMAAISNVLMTLAGQGDNVVASATLFGNTHSLMEQTLSEWGLEARFVDFCHPEAVEQAIDSKTRLLFVESISNPQMEIIDFEAIASIAHKHNVPLVVDNTVTTSYLFDAKAWGADIEVLSSTKYISGGGTSVGGVILDYGSFDWKKNPKLSKDAKKFGKTAFLRRLRTEVYRNFGACLSPHNAYLQTLGLETLSLRIDRSCKNTLELALFLESHAKVEKVNYPGLESGPFYQRAVEQLRHGFGGILTFNLRDRQSCFEVMDTLKLIKRATNINDNKTLMIHPASTIFAEYDVKTKEKMGVPENMLRLSVGIEDVEDLIEDLEQALSVLK